MYGETLGRAAWEQWGSKGVPVFPCAGNKRPLTKHGFYDASTDEDTVLRMFTEAGKAAVSIGGAMGDRSGLFAVDFDTYKDGASEYKNILVLADALPLTRVHKTKSGGEHYIYFVPEGERAPKSSVPHAGVEVKGEGGYIILPPTKGYEVVNDNTIEAPQSLLSRLQRAEVQFKTLPVVDLEQLVIEGDSFHEALAMIAAKRHGRGDDPKEVISDLIKLMNSSVASHPRHKRHDRWAAVMAGNELGRISTSAFKKYNPRRNTAKLEDAIDRSTSTSDSAVDGFFGAKTTIEDAPVVEPDAAVDIDKFPFDRAYNAAEVDSQEDKQFLLYPLIMQGDVIVLSAEPKAGKTLTAMHMCLQMAAGLRMGDKLLPLNDKGEDAKIPVIYFALEGQGAIRKRVRAWLRHQKQPMAADDLQLYVVERPLNLTDAVAKQNVVDKLMLAQNYFHSRGWGNIGMVVFDTLTKTMPGKDQNSVEDTSSVFEVIGMLREVGVDAAIMYIHHNNKSGSGPRGSGNIMAEPDTVLAVSAKDERVVDGKATPTVELSVFMARAVDDTLRYQFAIDNVAIGKNRQGIEEFAPVLSFLDSAATLDTVTEHKIKQATAGHKDRFYAVVFKRVTEQEQINVRRMHRYMTRQAPAEIAAYYSQQVSGQGQDLAQLLTAWRSLLHVDKLPEEYAGVSYSVDDEGIISMGVDLGSSAKKTG